MQICWHVQANERRVERFWRTCARRHVREENVSMATVVKERWVGEVDNGHPRRGLVNQGSNSGDPQPLYEVDVFNPAFPDEEVETRKMK